MNASDTWKAMFHNWPASLPRRGILVTSLNESTPFKGFMVKDDLVLLERNNPDSLGGRFALVGFDAISTVKFTDPLREAVFTTAGFTGKLAKE
jgi:hypothetical protein